MCPLATEIEALGRLYHSLVCIEFIFNEILHNLVYKFVAVKQTILDQPGLPKAPEF